MFNHIQIDLPSLERTTIEGKRFYKVGGVEQLLISITTVISFFNAHKFKAWRERVGEEAANRKTAKATSRGTDMHTLTEAFLKNEKQPTVQPLSHLLFNIAKKDLERINNVYCLESGLYSEFLGVAGTVDCIAEFDGELAIIDFKTSAKPKKREWIDHYFVQCAAYACMFYEMTNISVKKFVIIMACEDGTCEIYEEYDKTKYIRMLTRYIRNFAENHLAANHGQ